MTHGRPSVKSEVRYYLYLVVATGLTVGFIGVFFYLGWGL